MRFRAFVQHFLYENENFRLLRERIVNFIHVKYDKHMTHRCVFMNKRFEIVYDRESSVFIS